MGYHRTTNGILISVGKFFLLLVTTASLTGCGGDDVERVEISGQVSYQGKPVEDGYVTLTPLGEGVQSGAKIVQGDYHAVGRGAVPVGKYRVQISWLKEDKSQQTPGFNIPTMVNLIPYKYNKASKLTLDVLSGESSMTQDYNLD